MEHRSSIFSQKLDRTALTAYFLGAIVPLIALGVVVDRFVLPGVDDRLISIGLIAAVISIAMLSMASFLTLRITTRRSLERMDRDNRHLVALLDAAGNLAAARYGHDAAEVTANGGMVLSDADACFVFSRSEPGAAPTCLSTAGGDAEKLQQRIAEPLASLVNLVMSEGRPALRAADGECAALAAIPIAGEAAPMGAIVTVAQPDVKSVAPEEISALSTLGSLTSVALRNGDLQDAQRNFFTHVTDMLVAALDSHLGYHSGHSGRVALLANRIGRSLGLEEHRMQRLHFAALLHDIGLLKLDRKRQIDPRSASAHAALGARMLGRIRLWQDLAPIVQHHHERWDGGGYPEGLSADAIPLESRIIAVCEVFDTITNASSYKEPLPFEQGVHEIEAHAGRQFDPDVVGAFLTLVREGQIVSMD
ncbi:MAG: HD domain-containing protein [Deltaproteobacteria bacterium]|nr:HD domain-containing protein [Deltaproteobacteria bacterium]MBW2360916.1 HD domain-containing protein [Deltaproteobacteria bacterium]